MKGFDIGKVVDALNAYRPPDAPFFYSAERVHETHRPLYWPLADEAPYYRSRFAIYTCRDFSTKSRIGTIKREKGLSIAGDYEKMAIQFPRGLMMDFGLSLPPSELVYTRIAEPIHIEGVGIENRLKFLRNDYALLGHMLLGFRRRETRNFEGILPLPLVMDGIVCW